MSDWLKERPALRELRQVRLARWEDSVLVRSGAEVLAAREIGIRPENVFFPAPFDAEAGRVLDCCRFVAGSLEDLKTLEQAAEQAGPEGVVRVGLRLQAPGLPRADHTLTLEELAKLAGEIKRLPRLTVRGCFFCGDLTDIHGKALGRFFRAGYEAAKHMTVTLPCAMPYLCYENAAAAVEENERLHPETLADCLRALDIVTMQNETAFYAKLYLT